MTRSFSVDESRDGDRALIRLRGEVDMATAPRLRAALERAADASEVHVDLREVDFMDSTGLSALVAAHQAHERVTIACPPGAARRALEVSGLLDLLNVSDA